MKTQFYITNLYFVRVLSHNVDTFTLQRVTMYMVPVVVSSVLHTFTLQGDDVRGASGGEQCASYIYFAG